MFERRLKIFLLIVFGISLVLCLRAMQIQLMYRSRLEERAERFLRRPEYIETVRGRILDSKGREIAVDVPCIDAVVAYPAVSQIPDAKWVEDEAGRRLARRLGEEYTKQSRSGREAMRKEEADNVRQDLLHMWDVLGHCEDMTPRKLDDAREAIVRKVESRKRWIWYRAYMNAVEKHDNRAPEPWYKRWLMSDDRQPELDEFKVQVADELASHAVLKAIKPATVTMLGKDLDRYPGLSLRPSTHRGYPYREAGCHWIGTLSPVTREEREKFPNYKDELRGYDFNDLVGRGGVESLAEPILRGSRGLIEKSIGTNQITNQIAARPGGDVRVSIDIELQAQVQEAFKNVKVHSDGETIVYPYLHGAAVVIEVPTGQVRALASYPAYDLNELDQLYPKLVTDEKERPLVNRATLATLEPGSTVKPLVGLWAIKQGVFNVNETIECTGYMTINGRQVRWNRCWVASKFEKQLRAAGIPVAHHHIPTQDPHPTGFLTFADALERSCNPFFQTLAERLGFERLAAGMSAFGMGQYTGIGIPERRGLLPRQTPEMKNPVGALWSAGIGQGRVAATPLQMANVAATVARGGVWVRPTLLADRWPEDKLHRYTTPDRLDREDLHLSPESVAMAQQGMWNVVHEYAGTGKHLNFNDVGVCGKTGTAQAAVRMVPVKDAEGNKVPRIENGQPVTNKRGQPLYEMRPLVPSSREKPNPDNPWYLGGGADGTSLAHAWYIGFAPRQNPKIAFCVMIEYGGSGGMTAAAVAKEVLAACVEQGYLQRER